MTTLFQKQVQFTSHVKAAGRLREFNFLKLKKTGQHAYHVDVADERGNRHEFTFLQEAEKWRIIGDDVPTWVLGSAAELEREITNNEPQG